MKEFITIGKISKNCKSLIIYCGDYTSDDTTECTFNIINNKISAFDSDFSYQSEEQIFKPNSKALIELSNNIKSCGMELSANSIYSQAIDACKEHPDVTMRLGKPLKAHGHDHGGH